MSFDVVCIDRDGYWDRILGILRCHPINGIEGTGNLLTSSVDSSGVEGTGNPRRKHSKRSCEPRVGLKFDVDYLTGHYGSWEVAHIDGRGRVALDTIYEYLVVAYSEDDISC